jgi:MerR family transcriptional regulator, copper efflux regulator
VEVLSIGDVARNAGVGVETVRFYERQGLLAEPNRKASGYRQYGQDAVKVLRFIRRAKQLGFTLREIKSLLRLSGDASATRADVRRQAKEKLEGIEEKLQDLQQMKLALQRLIKTCHGDGSVVDCPILEALNRDEES